jgi:hypothetical protein
MYAGVPGYRRGMKWLLVLALVACEGGSKKTETAAGTAKSSADARRDLAQRNSTATQTLKTSGVDSTVLEVGTTTAPCGAESLKDLIANSGAGLVNLGFVKVKCIDGVEMSLISPAAPTDAAVPVSVAAPRGSLDARHAFAKTLRTQGFTVQTTGADETTIEMAFRGQCKASNLAESASEGGQAMVESGFVMLKCIGGSDSIALLDEQGAPTAGVGVSAKWLFTDYQENEIAADARYRGKPLRVVGKITRIGKDVLDTPFVELATANQFEGVHASFPSEDPLRALKKGQQVALRCTGKGLTMGSPMLSDCTLE